MIGLLLFAMLTGGHVKPKDAVPIRTLASPMSQTDIVKNWAIARCLARGASGAFAHDAAISAAALLERGEDDIETYEAVEALVGRQLAKRYGGSVPGDYVTLKCLDLAHDMELERLVARRKATPVH